MTLPDDVDKQCINLCRAINLYYPDFFTVESCCGHGKRTFKIWLHVNKLGRLPDILYFLDNCHSGFSNWRMEVYTDCGMSPATFMIEGGIGKEAYAQANTIAKMIKDLNSPVRRILQKE